jgi:hypothetical protein
MRDALKYILYFAALLAVGPLAGLAIEPLRLAVSGGPATLLTGQSAVMGILAGLGIVALAGFMGIITARLVGLRWALAVAGMVIIWPAINSATMLELVRAQPADVPGTMMKLALEGLLLAILTATVAGLMEWQSQRNSIAADELEPISKGQGLLRFGPAGLLAKRGAGLDGVNWMWAALGLVVCIIAGYVGMMLLAKSMMKGQTIAASAAGGLIAAMIVTARFRGMPMWVVVLGVMLASVAGQLAGGLGLIGSSGELLNRALDGSILASVRPTPLHVAAGVFIGLPLGLSLGDFFRGWVNSSAAVAASADRRGSQSGRRA